MDLSKLYKEKRKKAIGLSEAEWELLKNDAKKADDERESGDKK